MMNLTEEQRRELLDELEKNAHDTPKRALLSTQDALEIVTQYLRGIEEMTTVLHSHKKQPCPRCGGNRITTNRERVKLGGPREPTAVLHYVICLTCCMRTQGYHNAYYAELDWDGGFLRAANKDDDLNKAIICIRRYIEHNNDDREVK